MDTHIETVIIGAGQAGLATGYHLQRRGRDVRGPRRARPRRRPLAPAVGHAQLYSPAQYDGLPGPPFPRSAWSFPGKDEVGDYLEAYAATSRCRSGSSTRVERLDAATAAGSS